MALHPITQNPGNKITLQTWPHLREGSIEDGYSLAFASKYTSAGPTPKNPMVIQLLPDDDWKEVSPKGWDGMSEVSHQGRVVYKPKPTPIPFVGPPPPPRIDAFQQSFQVSQDKAADAALARATKFMEEEQKRTKNKKLMYIGAGIAAVVIIGLIYYRYFS